MPIVAGQRGGPFADRRVQVGTGGQAPPTIAIPTPTLEPLAFAQVGRSILDQQLLSAILEDNLSQ